MRRISRRRLVMRKIPASWLLLGSLGLLCALLRPAQGAVEMKVLSGGTSQALLEVSAMG
jgi:hypothetical protein